MGASGAGMAAGASGAGAATGASSAAAATGASGAAVAAAAGVSGAVAGLGASGAAAASAAAAGGAAAGGAAAGGGILSAFGIGVLAGGLTLGVVEWTGVSAPVPVRQAQEAYSASAAPTALPARRAAAADLRRVLEERADQRPASAGEGPASAGEGPAPAGEEPAPAGEEPAPAGEEPAPAGEEAPLAAAAAPASAAPAANSPRAPERRAPTLASELALLDTARRALRRGDPAAALALLDRHAREFASAQLADEAAVIRVEALASQGNRAGAHAAARRFLEAHPGSPHADRIESAAGIDARGEGAIPGSKP
jgi:hypothetical protein